jgi:hypothetical protein
MEVEEVCCFLGCDVVQLLEVDCHFNETCNFGMTAAIRLKYCYISTRRHGVISGHTTVLSQYTDKERHVSLCRIRAGHGPLIVRVCGHLVGFLGGGIGDKVGLFLHRATQTEIEKGTVRKYVDMTHHFTTEEPTLIVIISREFVAERLSSDTSAEAIFWRQ